MITEDLLQMHILSHRCDDGLTIEWKKSVAIFQWASIIESLSFTKSRLLCQFTVKFQQEMITNLCYLLYREAI